MLTISVQRTEVWSWKVFEHRKNKFYARNDLCWKELGGNNQLIKSFNLKNNFVIRSQDKVFDTIKYLISSKDIENLYLDGNLD